MCKSPDGLEDVGGHGKRLIVEIALDPLGVQTMTTKKSTGLSVSLKELVAHGHPHFTSVSANWQ